MNAIRSLFTALSNLAASINALASVIDVASGRLPQQLALDGNTGPVLEHQPFDDAPRQGEEGQKLKRTPAPTPGNEKQAGRSPGLFRFNAM